MRKVVQKPKMDAEARDMVACMVFSLVELQRTAERSAEAWEKRGYWLKSERFLRSWSWASDTAADLDDVIRNEAWDLIPDLLVRMAPHFADIAVKTFTRGRVVWDGSHRRLLQSDPLTTTD